MKLLPRPLGKSTCGARFGGKLSLMQCSIVSNGFGDEEVQIRIVVFCPPPCFQKAEIRFLALDVTVIFRHRNIRAIIVRTDCAAGQHCGADRRG